MGKVGSFAYVMPKIDVLCYMTNDHRMLDWRKNLGVRTKIPYFIFLKLNKMPKNMFSIVLNFSLFYIDVQLEPNAFYFPG